MSAPVSGSTPHSLRPTFSWSASSGASSYTLVVSSSSSYSSPLINTTINNSLTSYTPSKDLSAGKKLYARIMANGANPSAWSSINFTTPLPPSVPALVYPANNASADQHHHPRQLQTHFELEAGQPFRAGLSLSIITSCK